MKKIISLFQRNYEGDHLVRDEVVPGAEWVIAGEGEATRKWDGTCAMRRNGKWYKRYDAKPGRVPPEGFEAAQEPDPVTGHHPGWVPVGDGPEDRWFREAMPQDHADGTYELCGPKIGKNSEKLPHHFFLRHGAQKIQDAPRTFHELKEWFKDKDIEGIVWHHLDGRMVKIKGRDFGIKRGSKQ